MVFQYMTFKKLKYKKLRLVNLGQNILTALYAGEPMRLKVSECHKDTWEMIFQLMTFKKLKYKKLCRSVAFDPMRLLAAPIYLIACVIMIYQCWLLPFGW